jgi:formate dehydrogenase subunit gamma
MQKIENIIEQQQKALNSQVLPESELLQTLILIQQELSYIPKNSISTLAEAFNISRADVHGVVTFYDDLKLQDAPSNAKKIIRVCQAEACQSMGVRQLMQELESAYPKDGEISIEKVYCLGNCALAPAAMIDNQCYGNVSISQIKNLLA